MPVISEYNFEREKIREVLEGIYNTVIIKDVAQRNKISDIPLLQKIVLFLSNNIGNITSANNISNYLISDKQLIHSGKNVKPAQKTTDNYLKALENAYIFYHVKRYNAKGKVFLKTLGKYYIADIGVRNMLLKYKNTNMGNVLENIVFLELLRRGYDVSIGKVGVCEIDLSLRTQTELSIIRLAKQCLARKEDKENLRLYRL
ncbi:MAG: DUF4143 domain-containing protein [Endomicrobium sp.]|jgi:predicted AAA+ superfamily ATPase|nr:DUF4143 domain-containing protein [Endomicrobium sp.]